MALLHCEIKAETIRMVTSVSVILPHDIHCTTEPVKALYLLHGRSHNHSVWTRYTALEQYAEQYNLAVIMPEVNRSFYSNMKYGVDYHTYISEELPKLCESMFHISTDSKDRYVAGMSMGGYGALKTALSSPDRYAGCAAISAVTDIRQHIKETPASNPKKQEFEGIFGSDFTVTTDDDMFELSERQAALSSLPKLYLACGTEDHLYEENIRFRNHLSALPYKTTYEEWPGIHDWIFWDEAVKRLLKHFFFAN